jgi:hypothetical protein
MTFAERALYHQIHPAKLFADIATAFIGIDLSGAMSSRLG